MLQDQFTISSPTFIKGLLYEAGSFVGMVLWASCICGFVALALGDHEKGSRTCSCRCVFS